MMTNSRHIVLRHIEKIFLPLVFIGVALVYMFSRQPASALAGLVVARDTAGDAVTEEDALLVARLSMLEERAAKLASTSAATLASRSRVAASPPTSVATTPPPSETIPTSTSVSEAPPIAPPAPMPISIPTPSPTPVVSVAPPVPAPIPTPEPAPAPVPVPAPTGPKDGTYTGSVAQAGNRGPIQVRATVAGGKIIDIIFLAHPTADPESVAIYNRAAPKLIQEAIAAQSADVAIVSGATLDSNAFIQSLSSALAQA